MRCMVTAKFDPPMCPKCRKRPCAMLSQAFENDKTRINFANECHVCLSNPEMGK